ncbi:MAG TPA: ParB/RepB/Spo0J family partition protein [Longimicrobiaceae bacterium]|nr:ParB/RepB/Spo0J family partition protein [Longimicrobiaceae bacterium]
MAKKQALGKGLNALLPSVGDGGSEGREEERGASSQHPSPRLYQFEDRVRLQGRVTELDVHVIERNPYQPRTEFNEDALNELAESIKELGIIQPITVRALGSNRFELISGERRLRAAIRAGLKRIPAFVREADAEEMLEMAIVENIQREDLNPIEEALGYHRLMEECGLTQEDVAKKVSKNRSTISNALRLLRLPPRAQACLRDRTITAGHARALVSNKDPDDQSKLLDRILKENLSVREVEERGRALVRRAAAEEEAEEDAGSEAPAAAPAAEPVLDTLQLTAYTDRLRTHFSTKVAIRHKSDGSGRIELEYYTQSDLERVLELLLRESD